MASIVVTLSPYEVKYPPSTRQSSFSNIAAKDGEDSIGNLKLISVPALLSNEASFTDFHYLSLRLSEVGVCGSDIS